MTRTTIFILEGKFDKKLIKEISFKYKITQNNSKIFFEGKYDEKNMLTCNGKDVIKELLNAKMGDDFLRILRSIIKKSKSKINITLKLICKYEFLIFIDSDNSDNIKFNFDGIIENYNTMIKVNVMNPNVETVLDIKNKKEF